MPDRLIAFDFSAIDQSEIQGFDCGDQSWELSNAEWITGGGVTASIQRGTSVWIYKTDDGRLIGFGSLGKTRWKWPTGDFSNLSIIPALAIQRQYWGQPAGPKIERYSSQLMDDLIQKSVSHDTDYLVLEVHDGNYRAIRFYESYGFAQSPDVIVKSFGGQDHNYGRMALRKR